MKNIVGLIMLLFITTAWTQDKPSKKEITFKTSAVCQMCKERIEDKLNYTKGVVFAELDVDSKMLTVKYKTKHLSEKEVKKIVTDLGYDADDIPRNKKAFKELPKCCQSEGHCREK